MTTFRQVKNNAFSHISEGQLNSSDLVQVVTVDTGEGVKFPDTTDGRKFRLTFWDDVTYKKPGDDPKMKIGDALRTGDQLTIDFSIADNPYTGAITTRVKAGIYVQEDDITDLQDAINAAEDDMIALSIALG